MQIVCGQKLSSDAVPCQSEDLSELHWLFADTCCLRNNLLGKTSILSSSCFSVLCIWTNYQMTPDLHLLVLA